LYTAGKYLTLKHVHSDKMLARKTTLTIITKFIILLANFGLAVFTAQAWGSDGRGEIALVIANIAIISIFSNIFCGSTIAYHAPLLQRDFLLGLSLTGAIVISLSGAIIFSLFFGSVYFLPLFLISLLMSLTSSISTYCLGRKNIKNYNLLTLLNPLLILASLAILFIIFKKTALNTVFLAYYIGTGIVLLVGVAFLTKEKVFEVPEFNYPGIKSILRYGVINESNSLIQFLNYRLSYYFIARMLGLAELGIFSIAVAVSEAVWIISRSMSAIHFSNVINSDDRLKSRHETIVFVKQSLLISSLILFILVLIPQSLYRFIFGNEFGDVRTLIIYLLPGIIAISVSNLLEQYFTGIGKLKVIRNKSLAGLVVTLILLPVLIKKYQLPGACIATNFSYILSSLYLWLSFRKEKENKELNGS